MILEILKVIVLGIVEGFTEWLPISSTGHMILVDAIIPLKVSVDFKNVFIVVIQLGAILAVVALYFRKLNPISRYKKPAQKRATMRLWAKIVIACMPAAVFGFLLDDWMEAHLMNAYVVAIMLILYGVFFIIIENHNRYKMPQTEKVGQISYLTALYIGMFQILALVPGTSRSGATILGAMLLGCSRAAAAEFSFFLGIPIMFGASILKIAKIGFSFTGIEILYLILGMIIAFFVSVYSIKFLMGYIRRSDFKFFGYYRIILGIVVLIYFGITSLVG